MRGGGLYACGFAVTFFVLEAGSFIEDFKQIGMLFDGNVVGFVMNFIIDSFKNTIQAFIWPATVVQFAQPWGAIGLGLGFALFPRFVKPHVEAWMFKDEKPEEAATTEADAK